MVEIASILGRGIAIAIAGAGAFVIANYALDWLYKFGALDTT
jgi:hypothetical protein